MRKLARWSMLTAPQEARIEIKGAFLNDRGDLRVDKSGADRSVQIHEHGFT